VHVDVLGELVQRHAGVPAEHRGDVGQPAVEGVDDRVHLDPVARGEQHDLAHVLTAEQLVEQLGQLVDEHRGPLQHLDRGAAVRQPDHQNAHRIPSLRSVSAARRRCTVDSLASSLTATPRPDRATGGRR
jgi:hypothetical protein